MSDKIQTLLEQANARSTSDSSVNFARRIFSDSDEADSFFEKVKNELSDVKMWGKHAGISGYALFDETGKAISDGKFFVGAFLRVHLSGTGKYDWIKIIGIYESANEFIITVKPTFDPTDKSADETTISHFFGEEATNNFCLLRHENTLALYVIGLDEKQNTADAKDVLESVRNAAVANLGYFFGVQKGEWTFFCRNFLGLETE